MTKRFFFLNILFVLKIILLKLKKKKLRQKKKKKRKGKNQNILPNRMPLGWTLLCLTFLVGNAFS